MTIEITLIYLYSLVNKKIKYEILGVDTGIHIVL